MRIAIELLRDILTKEKFFYSQQKIKYSFDDEDDEDKNFDRSDDELFDTNPEPTRGGGSAAVQGSLDDGSDIEDGGNDVVEVEDSPVVKPKKAAPKRKLGPKADGPAAKAKAPAAKRGRKKDSGDSSEEEKPKKVS